MQLRIRSIAMVIFFTSFTYTLSSQSLSKSIEELKTKSMITNSIRLGVETQNTDRKSAILAGVLSAILPGMGELYADNFSTGKYSLISEASIWIFYSVFDLRSDWVRTDARSYAMMHSGASFAGKDDKFDVNIGNFNTLDEYNQSKLRNREFDLLYPKTEAYEWYWDNDGNRQHFRDLRIRADELARNAKFAITAMVINRIVSVFIAVRSVTRHNNEIKSSSNWEIEAIPSTTFGENNGIKIRLSKTF